MEKTRYKYPMLFHLTSSSNNGIVVDTLQASLRAGEILVQLADYDRATIKRTEAGEHFLECYVQQAPTASTFKEAGYDVRTNTSTVAKVETVGVSEVSKPRPGKGK